MFTGIILIPEGLVRYTWIGAGAKPAGGRLARYAGLDGRCHPTMKTLDKEIGVGARQAQKYVAELERAELIRRVERFIGRGQTSNAFEFLWHLLFEEGANNRSGGGVNDRSPKESHLEESQFEEKNIDLDYPPTNGKKCDSRAGLRG